MLIWPSVILLMIRTSSLLYRRDSRFSFVENELVKDGAKPVMLSVSVLLSCLSRALE